MIGGGGIWVITKGWIEKTPQTMKRDFQRVKMLHHILTFSQSKFITHDISK